MKSRVDLPAFRHIDLENGWIISCHQDLPVFYDEDRKIALIGYAWQVMPGRGTPYEEIGKLEPDEEGSVPEEKILEMEETWSGRYVLLHGTRVYTDASGLMGVFYCTSGISCDLGILAESMGLDQVSYKAMRYLNWMPGPLTPYEGIKRLLPSQTYDLDSSSVEGREILATSYDSLPDDAARTDRFIELFGHLLKEIAGSIGERKLLIALSGGYDSRCGFSAAINAGLDFSAFTFQHDVMSEGDYLLPGKLCKKTGTEYIFINRDKDRYDEEAERSYQRYAGGIDGGLVRDEDRLFYAYHQYHDLVKRFGDIVVLRGGIWEAAKGYMNPLFNGDRISPDYYLQLGVPEDSLEKRSLDEYFAWCDAHPVTGLNQSERLFLEQQGGCWLSYIEHGFDCDDSIFTVQPLNSRILLSIVMDYPEKERLDKEHQVQIALKACSETADVPYADDRKIMGETRAARVIRNLKRALYRTKNMGLLGTVRYYIKRMSDKR